MVSSRAARGPPLTSIAVSAMDQAVTFFLTSHVDEPAESCGLFYKYLPKLYDNNPSSALSYSVKAIGLAGLSTHRSAPELLSSASSQYSKALASIGSVLRNPALATSDEALLTVYLLGVYETDIGQEDKSMRAWVSRMLKIFCPFRTL